MEKEYKIGEVVCISVLTLYNVFGENLDYCGIDYISDLKSSDRIFELYDGFGNLVCMDGEECLITDVTDSYIVLSNEYGESDTYFKLSYREADVAIFR